MIQNSDMEEKAMAANGSGSGGCRGGKSGCGTRSECCGVDKRLLPMKAYYFFLNAGMACFLPYVLVFAKRQGLEAAESGVVGGVMPFLACLAQPLVGLIADRWAKHTAVIVTACLLSASFCVAITFVPPRRDHSGDVIAADVIVTCSPRTRLGLTFCGGHFGGEDTRTSVDNICRNYGDESKDFSLSLDVSNLKIVDNKCNFTQTDPKSVYSCQETLKLMLRTVRESDPDNTQTKRSCQVVCPNNTRADIPDRYCFKRLPELSLSHQNASDACNRPFPGRFTVESLELDTPSSPADSSDVAKSNGTHGRCVQFFQVASLAVDTEVYQTVLCDSSSAQDLSCVLECELSPPGAACGRGAGSTYDVTFWLIFVFYMLSFLAYSPTIPMGDAACYGLLGDRWHKYGRQRVWGTLGCLATSLGISAGVYAMRQLDYALLFYFYAVFLVVTAAVTFFIDTSVDIRCGKMLTNMGRVLRLPKVLALLCVAFMFSAMIGCIKFALWFLEDLGASPAIFGPYNVVGVITEIPVFFLAGRLIRRFGPVPCICVAMTAISLRVLGYALLSNPWLVLLIEPLHGVTIGLLYPAATTYVTWISPPGMEATSQGLLGGVLHNLGRGAGMLLTGWMFGVLGPRVTYAVFAGSCFLLTVIYGLLHCFVFGETKPPGAEDTEVKVDVRGEKSEMVETQRPLMAAAEPGQQPNGPAHDHQDV